MTVLEIQAKAIEAACNELLAVLAPYQDASAVIDEVLGGQWDYLDVTTFGGPPRILITSRRAD